MSPAVRLHIGPRRHRCTKPRGFGDLHQRSAGRTNEKALAIMRSSS